MPGDYSIFSFDPFEDHLGVLLQQGRVVLDADFNELVEILERRIRAGTLDTIGRCVVPKETPDGFRIQISGSTVTIGRGRIYVHGLLAENHGKAPLAYDARLGEQHGTLPIPYDEQPYMVDPPAVAPMPSSGGPHLLYIDVWRREVTHLEDPDLVEKAVAVDTATRLQTAWQVRALANVGQITCATPDDQIPGWPAIIAPSAGRLTTAAVGVPASTDPCILNPIGGYRGTENRLYRVEIHDRGGQAPATWKWSRDNNAIGATVLGINAGLDQLTVDRTRRDVVRGFRPGDWVEVTDDRHEFAFVPGVVRKVLQVDDVTGVITLAAALPVGEFNIADPPSRHTRVRRWDQKGLVLDPANNVIADVDANGGVIPVVIGQTYILEDGVQVTFSLEPAGGAFRVGDYWAFGARTVDASVEILTAAPPRGIKHHYCRLAVVTFPATVLDCRTLWPPDFGDHGCDCSACVTAESHNSGSFTIQMAIQQVQNTGGKVCLGPGVYQLGTSPVVIANAQSIRLHGHGLRTVLVYSGRGAAIQIAGSSDIGVDTLTVFAFSVEVGNAAVIVTNSLLVRIERTFLLQFGRGRAQAGGAVGLSGFLAEITLRDNVIFGFLGIQGFAGGEGGVEGMRARYMATFGLYIDNNFLVAQQRGIHLGEETLHLGDTRLAGNSVYGCRESAVTTAGLVLRSLIGCSRVDIQHNEVLSLGHGIVVSTDDTRIGDNDVGILRTRGAENIGGAGDGIRLQPRVDADGVERCIVTNNRIGARRGNGIFLTGLLKNVLIKQNIIDGVVGGGIVMDDRGSAEDLAIENNQVLDALPTEGRELLAAIRVMRAIRVAIQGNVVARFGLADVKSPVRVGILVQASDAIRIAGNEISDIGPPGDFVGVGGGIVVLGLFNDLEVASNGVLRRSRGPAGPIRGPWFGILVATPTFGLTAANSGFFKRGDLSMLSFVTAGKEGFAYVLSDRIVIIRAGAARTSVRGNTVDADGDAPAVHVQLARGGVCIMTDNHCVQRPAEGNPPAVHLSSGAIVCSSNHLRTLRDRRALDLIVGAQNFTLLGNVRSGTIFLNGNPLAANSVWAPFNVLLP